jgi:predicted esterase
VTLPATTTKPIEPPPGPTSNRRRRFRRRTVGVAAAITLVVLAAACDLHTLAPTGPGPMRYRDQVFNAVTTTTGVPYGSAVTQGGVTQTLLLDVYRPAGDTATARPAIVWIHGGGFRSGSRTSAEIVDQATTFAKKGYLSVSISYRLSTNGCFPPSAECIEAIIDAREDAQAAVRFLRANAATYGVDTNRIAVAGTSAGAITALNVAYGSDQPGGSGNPGYSSRVNAAVSLSGARITTRVDPGEPGALLFHGTADAIVPLSGAQATIDEAVANDVHVDFTFWDGDGHVPYVAHRAQILEETTNFLYWTMDAQHAQGCCAPVPVT